MQCVKKLLQVGKWELSDWWTRATLAVQFNKVSKSMTFENIRYYLSVTCLVLGCSGLPTGAIVWCITEIVPLEGKCLNIAYLVTYVALVCFGLRFYIPRLRGHA